MFPTGPGRIDGTGKRNAMEVKTGDVVLFTRYAGAEIIIDDQKLLILKESDILAIAEK